eukprot:g79066.t1
MTSNLIDFCNVDAVPSIAKGRARVNKQVYFAKALRLSSCTVQYTCLELARVSSHYAHEEEEKNRSPIPLPPLFRCARDRHLRPNLGELVE